MALEHLSDYLKRRYRELRKHIGKKPLENSVKKHLEQRLEFIKREIDKVAELTKDKSVYDLPVAVRLEFLKAVVPFSDATKRVIEMLVAIAKARQKDLDAIEVEDLTDDEIKAFKEYVKNYDKISEDFQKNLKYWQGLGYSEYVHEKSPDLATWLLSDVGNDLNIVLLILHQIKRKLNIKN